MEQTQNKLIFLIPLLAFFSPIYGILAVMICLVLADTISGLWKSKRLGVAITSWGLSAFVNKLIVYCVGILLFFAMDKFLLNEFVTNFFSVPFLSTKFVSLVFCSIEVISIDENYRAVHKVGFVDYAKRLISGIKRVKAEAKEIAEK